MFERLMAAIRRAVSLGGPQHERRAPVQFDPEEPEAVEFRTLGPEARTAADGQPLLCPVTRQELKPPARIFQCQACSTCYSEAGWAFLCKVDRGRCCACGTRKSVVAL